MPTPRRWLAATAGADGRIYALGGFQNSGLLATVEAYTPSTDTWATLASMSTSREWPAAATGADGRIYAVGGTDGLLNVLASATMEAYTP